MGPEPRLTELQHTWNPLPVSARGGEGTEEWGQRGPHSHSLHHPHPESPAPSEQRLSPAPLGPTPMWEVLTLLQGQRAAVSGEGQECLEQQLGAEVRILQQSLY